jgi:hypothetical protein
MSLHVLIWKFLPHRGMNYAWLYLDNRSLCGPGHVCTICALAASGRVYTTEAFANPGRAYTT